MGNTLALVLSEHLYIMFVANYGIGQAEIKNNLVRLCHPQHN